jgi:hypothetical protein
MALAKLMKDHGLLASEPAPIPPAPPRPPDHKAKTSARRSLIREIFEQHARRQDRTYKAIEELAKQRAADNAKYQQDITDLIMKFATGMKGIK